MTAPGEARKRKRVVIGWSTDGGITAEQNRVRAAIKAGLCPWCADERTWKSLASHTVSAHGITGREIRKFAGLPVTARICAEEFGVLRSRQATDQNAKLGSRKLSEYAHRRPPAQNRPGGHGGAGSLARHRAIQLLIERHRAEYDQLFQQIRRDLDTRQTTTTEETDRA